MIYLASPYSHPNDGMRSDRYVLACYAAADLMRAGHVVFSPIAHSHPISRLGGVDPLDAELWERQDAPLLAAASEVWVLMLDGWRESRGVQAEIRWAEANGTPVRYLVPGETVPTDAPAAEVA